MDVIREFFDFISLGGFAYIPASTTSRTAKYFWAVIIIIAFIISGIIIEQTFEDWETRPISTTIETLPIYSTNEVEGKNVKFPDIIVCPPKVAFSLHTLYYLSSLVFLQPATYAYILQDRGYQL